MLKRKEKILISAMQLLGEQGIAGITMKKIADKENISEPALYKQFKNKGQILLSMIKEYEVYDQQIQKTVSQSHLIGREAILFYVERYAELYENYYQLTTLTMSMDLYFYNSETRVIMEQIRQNRYDFLRMLVDNYISSDQNKSSWESEILVSSLVGVVFNEIKDWRFAGRTYSLKEIIMNKIDKLI